MRWSGLGDGSCGTSSGRKPGAVSRGSGPCEVATVRRPRLRVVYFCPACYAVPEPIPSRVRLWAISRPC